MTYFLTFEFCLCLLYALHIARTTFLQSFIFLTESFDSFRMFFLFSLPKFFLLPVNSQILLDTTNIGDQLINLFLGFCQSLFFIDIFMFYLLYIYFFFSVFSFFTPYFLFLRL